MLSLEKSTYLEPEIHEVQEVHELEINRCLIMIHDALSYGIFCFFLKGVENTNELNLQGNNKFPRERNLKQTKAPVSGHIK